MRLACATSIKIAAIALSICASSVLLAGKADYQNSIDSHQNQFEKVALDLWNFAEMGYQETQSAKLLQDELASEGFKVTSGIADIPTAFKAE
ncbi:MAG: amidohydrolase, partial [Porticoccaceae bacterium]|nr:amidohydrolase [Porticoccaceae bacterium]